MTEAFDKQELLDELDGDTGFLAESVELFESDAPTLLEQIRDAVDRGDAGAVAVAAHTLKSMIGNFCAPLAFDAVLDVEALGRAGDLAECNARVVAMEAEIVRLQQALRDFLKEIQ